MAPKTNSAIEPKPHWLDETRARLHSHWVQRTGHSPGANQGTWACELARGCRTCNEHLSLPCSLLSEANEIGAFLSVPCFSDRAETFLRLYLILLSEFVQQLSDVAGLLAIRVSDAPRTLNIWSNCWAKDRVHILVQHHPQMIFADSYGPQWTEMEQKLSSLKSVDRCGSVKPCTIGNTEWLADTRQCGKSPDLLVANSSSRLVLVVPHMQSFLDSTCNYFRTFLDKALEAPEAVRAFESEHFSLRC